MAQLSELTMAGMVQGVVHASVGRKSVASFRQLRKVGGARSTTFTLKLQDCGLLRASTAYTMTFMMPRYLS